MLKSGNLDMGLERGESLFIMAEINLNLLRRCYEISLHTG